MYEGDAWVVTDDAEYSVTASLEGHRVRMRCFPYDRSGTAPVSTVPGWGGTLTAEGPDQALAVQQAGDPVLRTEDGGRGAFVVVGADLGTGVLTIRGSGKAPFNI